MRSAKKQKCEIESRIKCKFECVKMRCENMYKMQKYNKRI